jgi:hypothetical protein
MPAFTSSLSQSTISSASNTAIVKARSPTLETDVVKAATTCAPDTDINTWTVIDLQSCLVGIGLDIGPGKIDGIWGSDSEKALQSIVSQHRQFTPEEKCKCNNGIATVRYIIAERAAQNISAPSVIIPDDGLVDTSLSSDWAKTCPNGSCYGTISNTTGSPRTTYVHGYDRANGTHVGGYYRSHK